MKGEKPLEWHLIYKSSMKSLAAIKAFYFSYDVCNMIMVI